MPKLVRVVASPLTTKKYRAEFDNGKHTDFGAAGMDDYTLTGNKEQRDRYRTRHQRDLETGDPTRAGFLSYYILWGDSTNLQTNIGAYRRRFGL
jgi:hypothetical protein